MYKKYDVIYGEFREGNDESIQAGLRPAVVIQNDMGNKYSPTLIVLPLSSQIKKIGMPTHTLIEASDENGLIKDSMLLAEQATTIGKSKVKKIGHINSREIQKNIFRCFIYSAAYGKQDNDLQELQLI